jgi:hypothetical protein
MAERAAESAKVSETNGLPTVLPTILDVNRVCPLVEMDLIQKTKHRLPLMAGISIHCNCCHPAVVSTTGAAEFYCVCQIASTRHSAERSPPFGDARSGGAGFVKPGYLA